MNSIQKRRAEMLQACEPHAATYWSRRYWVRMRTSHFSGTFCFDAFADAFDYIQGQFRREYQRIVSGEYGQSWGSFDLRETQLIDTIEGVAHEARFLLFVSRCDTEIKGMEAP